MPGLIQTALKAKPTTKLHCRYRRS